ncbi:DUF1254 domain-containing protein [Ralstonia solanacearum]|uniref:DUF1254 domain-containing protein n=1 Tax=Ralstonia solanacearum TaxID=305 RepID=UPI00078CA0BB|nr:DUF1254 domain-containing protein [Ralstonia solanacearum]AMP38812.1 hypothetical protein LBM2029_15270 [Ralstonia solanacearum]AXV87639.1 hypothetical protein CJO78_15695 [Ralstonia solanacearum]AXW07104.1 hypothetical protein CJO82_15355 [Ralstonia solanacearum]AXW24881.1 hypothetical protein CJO86_15590 [Ralstonia solanacearum]AXW81797.1 hypothetical protein CJO98_15710 [Ralstonia solanacearum]
MTHRHAPARRLTRLAALALGVAALVLAGCSTPPPASVVAAAAAAEPRNPQALETLTQSIYVYAFPLMTTDALQRAASAQVPAGRFLHQRSLDDDALPPAVRARADTLASSAFLDLRDGPIVLSVPDLGRRHVWVSLYDAWTDIFDTLGSRTTGARAQQVAITPPGWTGALPAGVRAVAAPTSLVWVVARVQVSGPRDEAAARRLQDRFRLTPLEDVNKPPAREAREMDKPDAGIALDAARQHVTALDANAYFTRFAALLKDNPPHPADSTMLENVRALGIMPGMPFDSTRNATAGAQAIERGAMAARDRLAVAVRQPPTTQNGWFIPRNIGVYGLDYEQRAIVAWDGAGTDLPQDALIARTSTDADGMPLDSTHRYVLHFDHDQLPPENAGWALAAVGTTRRTPAPAGHRDLLSEADHPRLNRDGSLDICLQRDPPPKSRRANWLPVPTGPFIVRMTLTWPKEAALDRSWLPPAVQRQE